MARIAAATLHAAGFIRKVAYDSCHSTLQSSDMSRDSSQTVSGGGIQLMPRHYSVVDLGSRLNLDGGSNGKRTTLASSTRANRRGVSLRPSDGDGLVDRPPQGVAGLSPAIGARGAQAPDRRTANATGGEVGRPVKRALAPKAVVPIAPAAVSQNTAEAVLGITERRYLEWLIPKCNAVTAIGRLRVVLVEEALRVLRAHARDADAGSAVPQNDDADDEPQDADDVLRRIGRRRVGGGS